MTSNERVASSRFDVRKGRADERRPILASPPIRFPNVGRMLKSLGYRRIESIGTVFTMRSEGATVV